MVTLAINEPALKRRNRLRYRSRLALLARNRLAKEAWLSLGLVGRVWLWWAQRNNHLLGPVFWMELRTAGRRPRHFGVRVVLVLALFALLTVTWSSLDFPYSRATLRDFARLGAAGFAACSITQFLFLLFATPLYSAGAVASDRERRVLELVFATNLRNTELVAAKFLVRAWQLATLALAGAPVFGFCLLLGGVSESAVVTTVLLTLATVAFVACLGMFLSILARRVYQAVVTTYVLLAIAWLALPVVASVAALGGAATGPTTSLWSSVLAANPVLAICYAVLPGFGIPAIVGTAPDRFCILLYGGLATALLVLNVLVIRRWGLWASRERVVRDRKRDRQRLARAVWDNPVAWREVKTIAVHRRVRVIRMLALIFCVILSAPAWISWIVDLWDHRPSLATDLDTVSLIVPATATVAWLLMVIQGAVSFSHEREHYTLDALLTAPLSARYIVLGKIAGIFRSAAFALAFPCFFGLLAWTQGVASTRAVGLCCVGVLVAGLLAAAWGLSCSVRIGASTKALAPAVVVAALVLIATPLVYGIASEMSGFPWRSTTDWRPLALASPTYALSFTMNEDPRGSNSFERRLESMQPWYGRFGNAASPAGIWRRGALLSILILYHLASIVAAGFLLQQSMHRIETGLRIPQRSSSARRSGNAAAPPGPTATALTDSLDAFPPGTILAPLTADDPSP